MKKLILSFLGTATILLFGMGLIGGGNAYAAPITQPTGGGTGTSTVTASQVGLCLQISSSSPFAYTFGTCSGGSGGSTTTTINGAQCPTFTFSITTTTAASNITTSSCTIFFNLLTLIGGRDISVSTTGTINFVNTDGFITTSTVNVTAPITGSGSAASPLACPTCLTTSTVITSSPITGNGSPGSPVTCPTCSTVALANPSQLIDGATHNGSAATAMRSDAIPGFAAAVNGTSSVFTLGTTTVDDFTNLGVKSAIPVADSGGHQTAYAGSNCGAGQAVNGLTGVGAVSGCFTPGGGSTSGTINIAGVNDVALYQTSPTGTALYGSSTLTFNPTGGASTTLQIGTSSSYGCVAMIDSVASTTYYYMYWKNGIPFWDSACP